MKLVLNRVWNLVRTAVVGFVNDNALTHAAAMAFYAATSLAPILLIVVAIAGIAVGRDAAQLAVTAQLTGLLGPQGADLLQAIIEGASNTTSGVIAASIAVITLIASASGVFGDAADLFIDVLRSETFLLRGDQYVIREFARKN